MSDPPFGPDHVLGGEPQKTPEYSTPEVILAEDREEWEPFEIHLESVGGGGKPLGRLIGSVEGVVTLRIDDLHRPSYWMEHKLDFLLVRALLDWWETGAWTSRTLSDLGTKESG